MDKVWENHPWDKKESKLEAAENEIQKLRKTVATWQSKCSSLENKKLSEAKGKIQMIETHRKWLLSLLDFSYDWMGSCGCVQARDLANVGFPIADWYRKTGEVIRVVKEEIDRERKSIN